MSPQQVPFVATRMIWSVLFALLCINSSLTMWLNSLPSCWVRAERTIREESDVGSSLDSAFVAFNETIISPPRGVYLSSDRTRLVISFSAVGTPTQNLANSMRRLFMHFNGGKPRFEMISALSLSQTNLSALKAGSFSSELYWDCATVKKHVIVADASHKNYMWPSTEYLAKRIPTATLGSRDYCGAQWIYEPSSESPAWGAGAFHLIIFLGGDTVMPSRRDSLRVGFITDGTLSSDDTSFENLASSVNPRLSTLKSSFSDGSSDKRNYLLRNAQELGFGLRLETQTDTISYTQLGLSTNSGQAADASTFLLARYLGVTRGGEVDMKTSDFKVPAWAIILVSIGGTFILLALVVLLQITICGSANQKPNGSSSSSVRSVSINALGNSALQNTHTGNLIAFSTGLVTDDCASASRNSRTCDHSEHPRPEGVARPSIPSSTQQSPQAGHVFQAAKVLPRHRLPQYFETNAFMNTSETKCTAVPVEIASSTVQVFASPEPRPARTNHLSVNRGYLFRDRVTPRVLKFSDFGPRGPMGTTADEYLAPVNFYNNLSVNINPNSSRSFGHNMHDVTGLSFRAPIALFDPEKVRYLPSPILVDRTTIKYEGNQASSHLTEGEHSFETIRC